MNDVKIVNMVDTISSEAFEAAFHKIIVARGVKVKKSVVPSTWRPRDVVIEVNEFIQKEKEDLNFWKN